MENEIWKPIAGFDGYEVSNYGNVRSYWKKQSGYHGKNPPRIMPEVQRYLVGQVAVTGYIQYSFTVCKKTRRFYAHAPVLDAFVGPRPSGYDACHNDSNPSNNYVENLRWDTRKNNMADAIALDHMHGGGKNHARAERNGNATLTNQQVLDIRAMCDSGARNVDVAKAFNITEALVWKIKSRYSWGSI